MGTRSQGPQTTIEDRVAPRFTLLIRAAKLIVDESECLCLLRDISASGTKIRFFHDVPSDARFTLEFDNGDRVGADLIWRDGAAGGFRFRNMIDVTHCLRPNARFAKRDLRFRIDHRVTLHADGQEHDARIVNFSRQGGCLTSAVPLALDQLVMLSGAGLPDIEARIRWRGDGLYGMVFDTVFSFETLALTLYDLPIANDSTSRPVRTGDQAATKSIAAPFMQ
ncbi:MAG: PilZ domain-containing protein [Pontixanthobacter sp.]